MTSEEHLQISDILAYRERRLSADDHTMAARHLLRCAECREHLPLPTKEEFFNALFGDHLNDYEPGTWESLKELLAQPILGGPAVRNAVFASLLLLALLGFSFLMWTQPGSPFDENMVAVVTDVGGGDEFDSAADPHTPDRSICRPDNTLDSRPIGPEKESDTKPAASHTSKAARNGTGLRSTRPRPTQRAETRGASGSCEGQRLVDLEVRSVESGLRLIWNKVPNAILYTIYLSDLDERLIAQYETADETSYLVSVPLDKEKVYRWKLIATLKEGERVVSESQNFKVGDPRNGTRSPESTGVRKKTAASVRCAEVKQ